MAPSIEVAHLTLKPRRTTLTPTSGLFPLALRVCKPGIIRPPRCSPDHRGRGDARTPAVNRPSQSAGSTLPLGSDRDFATASLGDRNDCRTYRHVVLEVGPAGGQVLVVGRTAMARPVLSAVTRMLDSEPGCGIGDPAVLLCIRDNGPGQRHFDGGEQRM
jgi:hypothetical protein